MSLRMTSLRLMVLINCTSLVLINFVAPAYAGAGTGGRTSPHADGSTAGVEVTQQWQEPGSAQQPAAPMGAAVDPGYSAEFTSNSPVPQLCRWFNGGLAGTADWSAVEVCHNMISPAAPGQEQPASAAVDPIVVASRAAAQLTVPDPVFVLDPQPSVNKWNALAVGLPIWIVAENPAPVSTAVSEQGIDIAMTAVRGEVRFDWGDGTNSVCTQMRPRPANSPPLQQSPDCGHTYLKRGDYTITASAAWAVNWQAAGQTGGLPLISTAAVQVPIREFETVVVG